MVLLFQKYAHETTEEELQRVIGSDTIIHRAYTTLDQFNWTENELATYEELKRIYMDNKAAISQEIYAAKNRGIEKEKMQNSKISIASRVWNWSDHSGYWFAKEQKKIHRRTFRSQFLT